jgi:glycosyltransferase involved in cell wall biosynthesis
MREQSRALRILLVTPYSPFSTAFGAAQRSHLLLRALSGLGSVDVLQLGAGRETCVAAGSDGCLATATFRQLPFGVRKFAPDIDLTRKVSHFIDFSAYDVICARYLGPICKLKLPKVVPVVVDLDDLGYSYAAGAAWRERMVASAKTFAKRILERRALSRFRFFWFLCERDREGLGSGDGTVLPNVPIVKVHSPSFQSTGKTLLFVGARWYPPNRKGIESFLSFCWPTILKHEPAARLRLIGAASEDLRAGWARMDGVCAPGFVPDIVKEYEQATFTIAPIFAGGGTNIKVLESFAYGRSCVSTKFCLEGFRPYFDGASDLIATNSFEEMSARCIELLNDPARRELHARRGHGIVNSSFSIASFSEVVRKEVLRAIEEWRAIG